MEKSSKQSRHR